MIFCHYLQSQSCWKWISLSILRVILICGSKASSFSSSNKIIIMYIDLIYWFYFCLWTVQNYIFNFKTVQSIQSTVPFVLFLSPFFLGSYHSTRNFLPNSPEIARKKNIIMKVRESHDMRWLTFSPW